LKPQLNMKWLPRTGGGGGMLGIAVGERAWTVAEVVPSKTQRGSWELRRVAEFVPPSVTPGAPAPAAADVGQALGQFLREQEFASRDVVVGVPAKWLVGRDKEIPPADPLSAAEILRLQAERSFSTEMGDLAYDYAGSPNTASPTTVLLLALPRTQLDRIVAIAEAAGRQVAAVTPSTLALADVPSGRPAALVGGGGGESGNGAPPSDGLVLNVTADAVELSARAGGNPRLLRHLAVRGPDLISKNGTRAAAFNALAGEIRRTLAMIPSTPGGTPATRTLQLWDGAGLGDTSTLSEQVGVEVRARPGVTALRVTGPAAASAGADAGRYAPAVALALAGADRRAELVDFLHPRLAPPKRSRVGRREQWAAVAGGVVVLLVLIFWLDLSSKKRELEELTALNKQLAPGVQNSQAVIDRTQAARPWFDARPPTLEPFRELTAAFPDTDPIYVTSFTLSGPGTLADPSKVRVNGRAPDEAKVFSVGDKLRKNPKFSNVSVSTDAVGNSKEIVFTIVCNYTEQARPASAAGAAAAAAAAKPGEVRK
jgi:hypothetical protein